MNLLVVIVRRQRVVMRVWWVDDEWLIFIMSFACPVHSGMTRENGELCPIKNDDDGGIIVRFHFVGGRDHVRKLSTSPSRRSSNRFREKFRSPLDVRNHTYFFGKDSILIFYDRSIVKVW